MEITNLWKNKIMLYQTFSIVSLNSDRAMFVKMCPSTLPFRSRPFCKDLTVFHVKH